MVIDLDNSYEKLKSEVGAVKSYTEAKTSLQQTLKNQGDNFQKALKDGQTTLEDFKQNSQKIKQDTKNQFSQLFDILSLTNGQGNNTLNYFKNKFIQTVKTKKPEIKNIIIQEVINAVNCDSQQQFVSNTPIYININSIDFFKQLKIDPTEKRGKFYYEKELFSISNTKKSLNRELYNRTQQPNVSLQQDFNSLYKGGSGQDLFNITYVETDNQGNSGQFFKIELSNRVSDGSGPTANRVASFLTDYYSSIEIIETHLYSGKIMDLLTGSLSIEAGEQSLDCNLKLNKYIERILGLCFDSAKEIDVQGSSKIPELDGIEENFFELTSLNERSIEEQRNRYLNGVIELTDCDNVQLPINNDFIFQSLSNIISGSTKDELDLVANLPDSILSNLNDDRYINLSTNLPSYKISLNNEFIKNLPKGLVMSILSPKVILPLIIMIKSLTQSATQSANQNIDYLIDNVSDFFSKFKKFTINIVSRIIAIFVKEIFEEIKKDIFNLLKVIVKDLAKEKAELKILMVTKLVQVLVSVAKLVQDFRDCKSVIDDLLGLFKVLTTGYGNIIPLPLLFASQALDGYSYTRAFLSTIEEMQKLGIPTGNLPSGAPNKFLLAKLSQMKSMAQEEAINGKVQIAVPALAVAAFGGGTTIPASAYGKKF
jgi:hypothetical protein